MMQQIITPDMTSPRQLALDEALLLAAQAGGGEAFRTWEFCRPTLVLGRSSKVAEEVNRGHCDDHGIDVLRRCSGGASVVAGPGCLMYSVVLSLNANPELRKIDLAHRYVMGRVSAAVRRQQPEIVLQGTCDLTWRDRKFSGNSLRIARDHLLYHGTILYSADLRMIADCLGHAPRQPDYRAGRHHADFITNVPIDAKICRDDLAIEFGAATASGPNADVLHRMTELLANRYDNPLWHHRH